MNTSVSDEIKFDFTQIQQGLIAFIADFELKLQKIITDLPVFVLQTGDGSFWLDKKFQDVNNKELYQKIPRFVITFDDFEINQDNMTNKFNVFVYKFKEKVYDCKFRRLPIDFTIQTDFVSSNFLKMLENFTILSSITLNPNPFTYEFLGSTFEGAYTIASTSHDKPGMEVSSATRNFSVKTMLTLQLHIVSPTIPSIRENTGYDEIKFDFSVKADDTQTELQEQLNVDITTN